MVHHYLLMLNRGEESGLKYGIFQVQRRISKDNLLEDFVLLEIFDSVDDLAKGYINLRKEANKNFNFTTRITSQVPCQYNYFIDKNSKNLTYHIEYIPDEARKGLIKSIYLNEI